MSALEIAGRVQDELVKRRWRRVWRREVGGRFTLLPDVVLGFATPLAPGPRTLPPDSGITRLLQTADRVLDGRWIVFDRERNDIVPAPDWFLDWRTGVRAPQNVYCFDIDHRDAAIVGNVKYVWELSRHQHLTVLAAAYSITSDRRYADCIAVHLRSWWNENPFLSGVHWTSGLEIGLRLIAWVWIRRLLDDSAEAPTLFELNRIFVKQLFWHQSYLARFKSRGSSANNHLIGEAAGLFVSCCAFPGLPQTESWRTNAAMILQREISRQTFHCGLNRELATDYHGFVLELFLVAALEGEAAGHSLGPDVWRHIRSMMDALAAVSDVQGRPPRQGDSDDGTALLLDGRNYSRWHSLLATGEELFGACSWWPRFPREDVRTAFWAAQAKLTDVPGERPTNRPSVFDDAGMVILRYRPGTHDEIWCRCDHGPQGYLSIAAHGHADALSIEVRHGGVDILADPGTYCYQTEPKYRAYFRSTLGHNTLELAHSDQATSGGTFLWTRHALATLDRLREEDENSVAEWVASHDGYTRLRPPAIHRRTVRLDRKIEQLVIVDVVDCVAYHPCRLAFHLGDTVQCRLESGEARLSWAVEDRTVKGILRLPKQLSWTAVSGQSDPPRGWYSAAFDRKAPSVTLIGEGKAGRGVPIVTVLEFVH